MEHTTHVPRTNTRVSEALSLDFALDGGEVSRRRSGKEWTVLLFVILVLLFIFVITLCENNIYIYLF